MKSLLLFAVATLSAIAHGKVSGTTYVADSGSYSCTLTTEAGTGLNSERTTVSVAVPEGDVATVVVTMGAEEGSDAKYCNRRYPSYPQETMTFRSGGSFELAIYLKKKDIAQPVYVSYGVTFTMKVSYSRNWNLCNKGISLWQTGKEGDLTDDEAVLVSFGWKNGGNAVTPRFSSAVYLDGVLKQTIPCAALAVGAEDSSGMVSLGILKAGDHTVRAVVDSGGVYAETSETDNVKVRTFTVVEGKPTLTVSPSGSAVEAEGQIVNLSVGGNVAWTALPDCDWLSVGTPSGRGRGTCAIAVSRNGGEGSRTGHVTFAGEGVASVTVTVEQGGMPLPAAPVVSVTEATTKRVDLSWTAAAHAVGDYLIYRAESLEGTRTLVCATNGLTWSDQQVDGNPIYRYWVSATNETGSATGDPVKVDRSVTKPVLYCSRGTATGGVVLSWTAAGHAEGDYQIYRAPAGGGETLLIGTTSFRLWCDMTAERSVAYHYWVVATNAFSARRGDGRVGYWKDSITSDADRLSFAATGGVASVSVRVNGAWSATSSADWISLSETHGSGDVVLAVRADRNYGADERIDTLRIASREDAAVITLRQSPGRRLDLQSGDLTIDTGADLPSLAASNGETVVGRVDRGLAVFDFDYVRLGTGVSVSVRGFRPLALISESDMTIGAALDVSGAETGRCGGGVGGSGGGGGEGCGGKGGNGGDGGQGGGWSSSVSGSDGKNGLPGDHGWQEAGTNGAPAGLAFNSTAEAAQGGAGGAGGDVGAGGAEVGNFGSGGSLERNPQQLFGLTHVGMSDGSLGNPGSDGRAGGDGASGANGTNAFASCLMTRTIVAGSAGGGGGGGGSGGGGGGGQGGGGGGGSSAVQTGIIACSPTTQTTVTGPKKGQGGGIGGKGADGGAGGSGGTGGTGGNGGGALVLQAGGRLLVTGPLDISCGGDVSPRAAGDPGPAAEGADGELSASFAEGLRAANGGKGGRGGAGGAGGAGGWGGCGAPGMVKLYGTEIDLRGATIVADNGNGDADDGRCGAVTYLSCLTDVQLSLRKPSYRNRVLEGVCRDTGCLLVPSVYDAGVRVPRVSPLRENLSGACGVLDPSFNRMSDVSELSVEVGTSRLTMKRQSGFHDGFDQLFIEKTAAGCDCEAIRISGVTVPLGRLFATDIWTTCVPTGTAVSLDVDAVTVVFDPCGGTCAETSRRCFATLPLGRLPTPRRSGCIFMGWETRREGGECVTADAKVMAGMTLYASWLATVDLSSVPDPTPEPDYDGELAEGNRFAIDFASGEGSGSMPRQDVLRDTVVTLAHSSLVAPVGKRFAGWICSNGKLYDDGCLVFNLAEPGEIVTLTAIWK